MFCSYLYLMWVHLNASNIVDEYIARSGGKA